MARLRRLEQRLAETLRNYRPETLDDDCWDRWEEICTDLAATLEGENAAFCRETFLEECGVEL